MRAPWDSVGATEGPDNYVALVTSDDDGNTRQGQLGLGDRSNVSCPDGVQAEDGRVYLIYDRERYAAKEILTAVFTDKDVLASQPTSAAARLKAVVNKVG